MRVTIRLNWREFHILMLKANWEPLKGEEGEHLYERVSKNRPMLLASFNYLSWTHKGLVVSVYPVRHPKLRLMLYPPQDARPGQVARMVEDATQFLWSIQTKFLEKPNKGVAVAGGFYEPALDNWTPFRDRPEPETSLRPRTFPVGASLIADLMTPFGICERIFYTPAQISRLSPAVWLMMRRHRFIAVPPQIAEALKVPGIP